MKLLTIALICLCLSGCEKTPPNIFKLKDACDGKCATTHLGYCVEYTVKQFLGKICGDGLHYGYMIYPYYPNADGNIYVNLGKCYFQGKQEFTIKVVVDGATGIPQLYTTDNTCWIRKSKLKGKYSTEAE